MPLKALGEQIRAHRVAKGWTQGELAKRAGISSKYVSEIERGTRDVPVTTLRAVVDGLGLVLEFDFRTRSNSGSGPRILLPPLPRDIDVLARRLADVPGANQTRVIAIVEALLELAAS
jgi:transcriptional regulator with XRE-family HTH domain|nr:helix-turn-helix transcriptional regulator [Kofleriaceae bacterium]